MEAILKLSPTISYQRYGDLFFLLDSRTGLDFQLNSEGGRIIEQIDSGLTDKINPDSDFINSLLKAGIICNNSNSMETQSSDESKTWNTSVFDDLNYYAAKELIPVSAIMELTYRCPLNCQHCYIDKNAVQEKNELKKRDYFKLIDEFRNLGGLYVILTGGDPFLHPDFEKIFQYLRKKRIAVSVMSSGYRIDKELLKKLASSGLTSFQASIHGHNPEIHDSFTGVQGSFNATMDTLIFLKKLGISVQAAVSVNRLNITFFDEILRFLDSNGIETAYNFEMFPKRNGDTSPVLLNISKNELFECLKKTDLSGFRLKGKGPNDPPCNAARSLFSIDPAGNIFPCLEIRHKAGNIKNKNFSDIWKNSDVLNNVRDIKVKNLKNCYNCTYKNYCNRCHGGALKRNLNITDHSDFDCTIAKFHKKLKER